MKSKGVLVLGLLYLLLPAVQAWAYLGGVMSGPFAMVEPLSVFNFVSSIFAYHWMLANVLVSLKVPIIQNALPYDLRIRSHVWSTMGIALMLSWHAVYTIFLSPQQIDFFSWVPLPIFVGLVGLSLLWVPIPGLRRLVLSKAYDVLKSSHKVLFIVLAAFSWWHVADRGLSILDPNHSHTVPPLSGWGYELLFLLSIGFWFYSLVREQFLPVLTVHSAVNRGGILRLTLQGHPRLNYRSGQFAFLRFLTPELRREEHPFSFTSSQQDELVSFAISDRGDFTAKLAALKTGDRVRINAGFGAFHPETKARRTKHPLALIGTGVGVAPLISILKDLHRRDPGREVVLLQSVKQRDELLEPQTVARLSEAMPNLRLKTLVYEEDGVRYSPEVLERALGRPTRYEVFLCSSDRVRKTVVGALRSLGVPRRRINYEAFSLG